MHFGCIESITGFQKKVACSVGVVGKSKKWSVDNSQSKSVRRKHQNDFMVSYYILTVKIVGCRIYTIYTLELLLLTVFLLTTDYWLLPSL